MVPSSVLAITTVFNGSVASPVTERSFSAARKRPATSAGQGPTRNVLRRIPDCMFHICIAPVEELANPKLPHAVTQTDYLGVSKRINLKDVSNLCGTKRSTLFPLALNGISKTKIMFPESLVLHSPCPRKSFVRMSS